MKKKNTPVPQLSKPEKSKIPNEPDEEDQKLLAGKSKSYVYGWNKVKYSK